MHETIKQLVCREVFNLRDGQGRAPKAARKIAAPGDSNVEMGADHDGLHHKVAENGEEV